MYAVIHLLNPLVFSILTRGEPESVLALFVLGALHMVLKRRWDTCAVLLGVSTHQKIYPIVYGVRCHRWWWARCAGVEGVCGLCG